MAAIWRKWEKVIFFPILRVCSYGRHMNKRVKFVFFHFFFSFFIFSIWPPYEQSHQNRAFRPKTRVASSLTLTPKQKPPYLFFFFCVRYPNPPTNPVGPTKKKDGFHPNYSDVAWVGMRRHRDNSYSPRPSCEIPRLLSLGNPGRIKFI